MITSTVDQSTAWTPRELAELRKAPFLTQEDLRRLARIRAIFDAEVISIEPLGPKGAGR